jgi:hypothetical protein
MVAGQWSTGNKTALSAVFISGSLAAAAALRFFDAHQVSVHDQAHQVNPRSSSHSVQVTNVI